HCSVSQPLLPSRFPWTVAPPTGRGPRLVAPSIRSSGRCPHLPPGCSRRAGGKRPWGVRERTGGSLSRPRRHRARGRGDRRIPLRGGGAGAGNPARGHVGRGDRRGPDGVEGARQTARIEHRVRMKDFRRWLESQGRTPAECARKRKLLALAKGGGRGAMFLSSVLGSTGAYRQTSHQWIIWPGAFQRDGDNPSTWIASGCD